MFDQGERMKYLGWLDSVNSTYDYSMIRISRNVLTVKQELTGVVIKNKKSSIRLSTADFSRWLKLVRIAVQTTLESIVERPIKSEDSVKVVLVRSRLTSLLIKKDFTLVILG